MPSVLRIVVLLGGATLSSAACSGLYQKCGGEGYTGPTCCSTTGATCQVINKWWSGCFVEDKCKIPVYKQCAGKNYTGSGCCAYGNTCKYINEWWSGCFPPESPPKPPTTGCSKLYGQCGGLNWGGPKCCESGSTCQVQVLNGVDNVWYSQCLPKEDTCDHPAKVYDQCGGLNYKGPRCCEEGSTCKVQNLNGVANIWYSQCLPPVVEECSPMYHQCDGKDYKGTTCCNEGQVCKYINEWWSGCFPGAVTDPTPPPASCQRVWGQCGGITYFGSTCCEKGSTCTPQILNGEVNKYYSQCLPDSSGDGNTIETLASKGPIVEACATGAATVNLEYKLKPSPDTMPVTMLAQVQADPKLCAGGVGRVLVKTLGHGITPPVPLNIFITCEQGATTCDTKLDEYATWAAIKSVTSDKQIQNYLFDQLSTVFSTYTFGGVANLPPTPTPSCDNKLYDQCGGMYFTGPKCCAGPATCQVQILNGEVNVYYSQCLLPPTRALKHTRTLKVDRSFYNMDANQEIATEEHAFEEVSSENAPAEEVKVPSHVAIIPDGSRRYGKLTGTEYPEQLRNSRAKIVDFWNWAEELGITTVTMYGLSVDNMNSRPQYELDVLYHETADGLMKLRFLLRENNRIVNVITSAESFNSFPKELQDAINIVHADCKVKIDKAEREGTALLTLNFLLGYGGKQETVSMARALARKVAAGELDPETIDFNMIESHLGVTKSPDLIIRTGGEMRLSNFLLLQSAYSEYFVSDKLWPAFQKEDLMEALADYAKRRKLGGK